MSPLAPNSPVHFIMPAQPLLRYVSTYYFFQIETDQDEEQEDLLHPEWGSAHFTLSGSSRGNIVTEPPLDTPPANVTGPTGKASRMTTASSSSATIRAAGNWQNGHNVVRSVVVSAASYVVSLMVAFIPDLHAESKRVHAFL